MNAGQGAQGVPADADNPAVPAQAPACRARRAPAHGASSRPVSATVGDRGRPAPPAGGRVCVAAICHLRIASSPHDGPRGTSKSGSSGPTGSASTRPARMAICAAADPCASPRTWPGSTPRVPALGGAVRRARPLLARARRRARLSVSIQFGSELVVSTEVIGFRRVIARRRSEFRRVGSERLVGEALTDWVLLNDAGRPVRPPDAIPEAFGTLSDFTPLRVGPGAAPADADERTSSCEDRDRPHGPRQQCRLSRLSRRAVPERLRCAHLRRHCPPPRRYPAPSSFVGSATPGVAPRGQIVAGGPGAGATGSPTTPAHEYVPRDPRGRSSAPLGWAAEP